jgi:hypothetical protein
MDNIKLSKKAKALRLGVYKHYKGKEYKVLGVALHSENLEELVIYQALYSDNLIWVRPIDMFLGEKKLENGDKISRFQYISE